MAYADSGITVRFHYQRTDGDYTDWNMWIWASGKDGTANEFTGEDDFGKYLDYAVDAGTAEVGFIVRLSEWLEKDVESDRFVDVSDVISGVVDVYIKTGVAEF
jgi:pullulanase